MDLITLEIMSKALENKLGLSSEIAHKVACSVMEIFGYEYQIIDNVLDQETRKLFYILETQGILSTKRETTRLQNGRIWFTHYWNLRKELIFRYAEKKTYENKKIYHEEEKEVSTIVEKTTVYSRIPDYMWTSRKIITPFNIGKNK